MRVREQGWRHLDDVVWKMGLRIMSLNVSYNKIEELPDQIGELILLKVSTNFFETVFNCSSNVLLARRCIIFEPSSMY